jgi:predicted transcriptional regulator
MKIAKFLIRGFRSPKEAISSSLGSLERDTMNQIWRLPNDVSVREISDSLGGNLAYTTVMTTLDRLYKKGFLNRRKSGKAFLYSARMSQEELERSMTETAVEMLLDAGTAKIEPVLACIVDAVSERDLELLDELERLVQEKRQEILDKN